MLPDTYVRAIRPDGTLPGEALRNGRIVPEGYEVVDRQTGIVVARPTTARGARRSVDRRDTAYGACRYYARPAAPPEPRCIAPGSCS